MNELVLLLLVFAGMLIIKIPIAYALGLSSLVVIHSMGIPLTSAINAMYNSVNNFSLLAIPLFMLLAQLMDAGGITKRLFEISDAFVGHIRGGLGHINIFMSLLFGHLSGSAQADAAGIGSMIIPTMKKAGYPTGFTVAVTATSSTLGVILPPSVLMVVYGAASGASIGALFVAGIVPGFLIAFIQMGYTYFLAVKYNWPREARYTWRQRLSALKGAVLVLILPLIIIVGTSSGMFTATESAAVACIFAFALIFILNRNYDFKQFPKLIVNTAMSFSLTMFAVASAGITGWLIAFLGAPQLISGWILGITNSFLGVYMLLIIFLLLIGTFLSPITVIIIFMPIISELAAAADINNIHMGIVVILTLSLAMVTPPSGTCLMITANIGGISILEATKHILPILGLVLLLILLGVIVPELFLFLPRLLVPAAF